MQETTLMINFFDSSNTLGTNSLLSTRIQSSLCIEFDVAFLLAIITVRSPTVECTENQVKLLQAEDYIVVTEK